MRNTLLFIFLVSLFACQQPSKKKKEVEKPQVDPKILVSCEGIGEVKLTDTYPELKKKFGPDAITEHENNVEGKFLSLWEGKPKQLNIIFRHEKNAPFKSIKYIETGASDSPYMTNDSLRVGLSLKDIVRRNGFMPLTFNNFYGEVESGLILSFNKGDLSRTNTCFGGKLEWVSQENIYKDVYDAFKKRKVVESSDDIFNRMEVMLGSIRVTAKQ